ncbi:serine hydrolase domain-containing protein, partial [Roseisolibacter sp. H3M3-2]|uniref:serine hydrolase domain-containing protein n=1 Tax=Roseisolibacter sp. H3M3-2 TaxID=3031323 RepID=UPI0023DC5944
MRRIPLLAAVLLALPLRAQDRTAEVDRIFAFATAESPGCAVGASQRGRTLVSRGYGLADLGKRTPIGERARFDIGSTQKQFTAAAILLLVEDGRLALADDVRKHLPELPDYGRPVTIDHLLTHTAGIRDWTGLLPMAPEGTDVLALVLRQRGLTAPPGEAWSYSSSGFELAKAIVARASGTSFAEFARKRLFAPLGMTATAYVPDVLQAGPDAALGYQKDGAAWTPYMRLGANRGGGAIVSTVGDLLRWQDALADGKLGASVTAKLHEPARLRNGRTLSYARGLIVESNRGRRMVWHSGGAAGFSTLMARFPEHALSVVVACNFDPVSATALGARVADLFLPPPGEQPARAAVGGVDVGPRAGLYLDERTGEPLRLAVNGGRLGVANGPPLVPTSATEFRPPRPDLSFRSQDDFTLTFADADRFEIRSMEGEVTRYRRARPWTPAAAELAALDGRYESPELGSVFHVVAGDGRITLRSERDAARAVELEPLERDAFIRSLMTVRFRRDAGGKVVGFDYGNPLVRGIAFTRLGDRAAGATAAAPAPDASNA